MGYNQVRTQNVVLTLPYWELKLFLIVIFLSPLIFFLTLPYWELKQNSIIFFKFQDNCLTLPYWELKLFCLYINWYALQLPYLTLLGIETFLHTPLQNGSKAYLTLLGIETFCRNIIFSLKFCRLPYPIGNWNRNLSDKLAVSISPLPYPLGNWNS